MVITKSLKIHTDSQYIELSEVPEKDQIRILLSGGGMIYLSREEWKALCGLEYSLDCYPSYPDQVTEPAEQAEASTDEL